MNNTERRALNRAAVRAELAQTEPAWHWCAPVQDNVPIPHRDRLCRSCNRFGWEIRERAS